MTVSSLSVIATSIRLVKTISKGFLFLKHIILYLSMASSHVKRAYVKLPHCQRTYLKAIISSH